MSAKTKRSKKNAPGNEPKTRDEVGGLLIVAVAVLAAVSWLFTDRTGEIGAFIYRLLATAAGRFGLLIPVALFVWGLRTMFIASPRGLGRRAIALVVLIACVLTAAHIHSVAPPSAELLWEARAEPSGGGLVGAALSYGLVRVLDIVGAAVVLSFSFVIATLVLLDLSLVDMLAFLGRGFAWLGKQTAKIFAKRNNVAKQAKTTVPTKEKPRQTDIPVTDYQPENDEKPDDEKQPDPPPKQEDTEPESPVPDAPQRTITRPDHEYELPPLSLLQKAVRLGDTQGRRDLVAQADLLESTLASFGVEARVINVHRGPTITRFEIQPAPGVKVSRIVSLADDLAMSLAATGVRIEAPIPGKSALGLEIANRAKATVYMREVLESQHFAQSPSILTIALGKDITGEPIVADLRDIPHLLIAGATGAGKSVCLNAIITSLLYKARPWELKLLLIDPKVVELNVFNGLPHLLCPVITDPRKAAQGLKSIVKEMEYRYHLFAESSTRDIFRYNEHAQQQGIEPIPYIFVVIDELADLMMTAAAEVEDIICRIAQKSRAAGIHLVVATQRPSVDVITGVIKANITSRIAFAVSSQADSRTILDMSGAEKLLGKGDMLYFPVGASKPLRIQSAYISDEEVEKVVAHVLKQAGDDSGQNEQFLEAIEAEEQQQELEMDELLPDASRMIVESGQASISMLQRRLRIGYTRAARLIDDMEQLGIVGGFEGSKARRILVNIDQLEHILNSIYSGD